MTLIVIVAAGALLHTLGFLVVSPVAMFIIAWILGYRKPLTSALVAVIVSGGLYLLLTELASLPLPVVPVFWG